MYSLRVPGMHKQQMVTGHEATPGYSTRALVLLIRNLGTRNKYMSPDYYFKFQTGFKHEFQI